MTELSAVRHLQPLERSASLRPASAETQTGDKATGASTGLLRWLSAREHQRDLIAVAAFCLIGLLLTFAVIAAVPDAMPSAGDISFVP
jgi:hypothetical protein